MLINLILFKKIVFITRLFYIKTCLIKAKYFKKFVMIIGDFHIPYKTL